MLTMKAAILRLFARERLQRDTLTALFIAVGFSLFIYTAHWGMESALLNTLAGLAAIWGLLTQSRRSVLFAGFFIGLLWFYWVGFSFRYYGMSAMVPLVSLFFGCVYAFIFGALALTRHPWLRALLLFGITFVEPFDFNWMVPEALFVHSFLGVEKWQFALILISLALFGSFKHPARFAALLLLPVTLDLSEPEKPLPPFSVYSVESTLPQEQKWVPANRPRIVAENFEAIEHAIDEGYQLVILNESAFPLFMNGDSVTYARLLEASQKITILTGALLYENEQNYNVTYLFDKGSVHIAKKMVLVPFGEYIPLPDFMRRIVNETFFNGASDYVSATKPTDFEIRGTTFRNAICYEATCEELYDGDPRYMIAISNNAWFHPSIEPTLQRLLMQFYAKKHNTLIIHVANMGGTGIIR